VVSHFKTIVKQSIPQSVDNAFALNDTGHENGATIVAVRQKHLTIFINEIFINPEV
jgi:hypothetical protein